MAATFDPNRYTSVPTRTPGSTLSLARALISAAASGPSAAVAKRLARLRARAELLQTAWIDANRSAPTVDVRALDVVLDRRWGAVRSRLEGCIELGDDDDSPRAQSMMDTLFPTGLDFLTLPFPEQWAQSERRLKLIETDGLADELTELAGAKYLPALQQAHDDYGEALGITKKTSASEAARVLEPLRDLQSAIASYARGVVGTMDEEDDASVVAAEQQLEPILRARRARSGGGAVEQTEQPEEPIEAPLPELPTEVEAS